MENDLTVVTSDPTNLAARLDTANKELAAFRRQHPSGWATTPKRGIEAMKAIRHREITIGRRMSEQEKDQYQRTLRE